MLDKKYLLILGFLIYPLGCSKKDTPTQMTQTTDAAVVAPSPIVEPPKEKPVYVYSGDKFRDPFTPSGQSMGYQMDAVFDPQKAVVRGIIYGSTSRSAIITVGGNGSFFVKSGRIYDIMGKAVDGYSAKVYLEKVVVLGEADNSFELKMKTKDEEAK